MSLRYLKIKKHPQTFLRLFGISPDQFEKIMGKLYRLWEKRVIARYKRPGRDFKLSLEDMVLMLLLYYRCYITQEFIGFLFNKVKRFIILGKRSAILLRLRFESPLTRGLSMYPRVDQYPSTTLLFINRSHPFLMEQPFMRIRVIKVWIRDTLILRFLIKLRKIIR